MPNMNRPLHSIQLTHTSHTHTHIHDTLTLAKVAVAEFDTSFFYTRKPVCTCTFPAKLNLQLSEILATWNNTSLYTVPSLFVPSNASGQTQIYLGNVSIVHSSERICVGFPWKWPPTKRACVKMQTYLFAFKTLLEVLPYEEWCYWIANENLFSRHGALLKLVLGKVKDTRVKSHIQISAYFGIHIYHSKLNSVLLYRNI